MRKYANSEHRHSDFEEAYLGGDLFHEHADLPAHQLDSFQAVVPEVLPKWLAESRIVCALVAIVGLTATLFNLDFLYWQFANPVFLNLILLGTLIGFASCVMYPYALTYSLVNGSDRVALLRMMNGFLLCFLGALLVYLLSFPISGLGLALILIPAPAAFALCTRKFLKSERHTAASKAHRPFGLIFNLDLRRLAWVSFILIFSAMMGLFFGLVFNIL